MVTIKEIAEATNVSASTVSRVLNRDMSLSVSDETRLKVIDTAQRLNYVKKTKKEDIKNKLHIAVLTVFSEARESNDLYWRQIYLSIVQSAHEYGIMVDEVIRIDQGLKLTDFSNFDAIIVLGDIAAKSLKQLQKINKYIVLVDAKDHYEDIDAVNPELKEMTLRILDELYQAGCQKIGFIGGTNELTTFEGTTLNTTEDIRSEIYQEWSLRNNKKPYLYTGPWHAETGSLGASILLEEEPQLDALLVASDPIALGAINALKIKGIEPGKEIAVASFDNLELASYLLPALTTVELNPAEIGKTALDQAYQLANRKRTWTVWSTIPSFLKYRETFAPK